MIEIVFCFYLHIYDSPVIVSILFNTFYNVVKFRNWINFIANFHLFFIFLSISISTFAFKSKVKPSLIEMFGRQNPECVYQIFCVHDKRSPATKICRKNLYFKMRKSNPDQMYVCHASLPYNIGFLFLNRQEIITVFYRYSASQKKKNTSSAKISSLKLIRGIQQYLYVQIATCKNQSIKKSRINNFLSGLLYLYWWNNSSLILVNKMWIKKLISIFFLCYKNK